MPEQPNDAPQGEREIKEDPRLRMALNESSLRIAHQREDLEKLRTRSVGLVSVASLGVALSGTFLGTSTRLNAILGSLTIMAFIYLVVATCAILAPRRGWVFENDGRAFVIYVDEDRDINEVLRVAARHAGDNADTNEALLEPLLTWHVRAVVALGVMIVSFLFALMLR